MEKLFDRTFKVFTLIIIISIPAFTVAFYSQKDQEIKNLQDEVIDLTQQNETLLILLEDEIH